MRGDKFTQAWKWLVTQNILQVSTRDGQPVGLQLLLHEQYLQTVLKSNRLAQATLDVFRRETSFSWQFPCRQSG